MLFNQNPVFHSKLTTLRLLHLFRESLWEVYPARCHSNGPWTCLRPARHCIAGNNPLFQQFCLIGALALSSTALTVPILYHGGKRWPQEEAKVTKLRQGFETQTPGPRGENQRPRDGPYEKKEAKQ